MLKILQVLYSLQKGYFSNILTCDFPAIGLRFSEMEVFQLEAQVLNLGIKVKPSEYPKS